MNRYGLEGKRYKRVAKRSVEYVIWPDIFQKKVMNVTAEDTINMFKDMFVKVTLSELLTKKYIIPNSLDMVVKYGGLSSLLVNS